MLCFRTHVFILLGFAIVGCTGGKVAPSPADSTTGGNSNAQKSATSDDVLTSALHQLRPENFGINSMAEKPVSLLNSWGFKQIEQHGEPAQPLTVKSPPGWATSDDETWMSKSKFDLSDALHIRDAMFFHAISGYLSDRGHDELQRVSTVVDFVFRNITIWKDNEVEIALQPYISLQLGRGSIRDRAWIASDILRQLRIDSVIVRASNDSQSGGDKWLLGAVVDRKIYLFDLKLGMPVWGGANEKGTSVATLADIVSHPEWLEQMAGIDPYRITAESLQDPTIYVITRQHFWCPRMFPLEQVLPAKDACVLYDPVLDDDDRKSLLQRIAAAGGFPVESLKQWAYPRQQLEALKQPSEDAVQELQQLLVALALPIPIDKDGKPGQPENKMQRYRTEHLLGKFVEATQKYLSIRHLEVEPYPAEIARLNRLGAEDAFFWTALCKYELRDYEQTVEQLQAYLNKYDHKGKWYFSARTLLAETHAELGHLPQAIAILKGSSSDDPNREGNVIRSKRWESALAK